jgi:hypothetical protein
MLIYATSVSVDGFIANREGERYGRAQWVGLIPRSEIGSARCSSARRAALRRLGAHTLPRSDSAANDFASSG